VKNCSSRSAGGEIWTTTVVHFLRCRKRNTASVIPLIQRHQNIDVRKYSQCHLVMSPPSHQTVVDIFYVQTFIDII
jgi:hypothetical protein